MYKSSRAGGTRPFEDYEKYSVAVDHSRVGRWYPWRLRRRQVSGMTVGKPINSFLVFIECYVSVMFSVMFVLRAFKGVVLVTGSYQTFSFPLLL